MYLSQLATTRVSPSMPYCCYNVGPYVIKIMFVSFALALCYSAAEYCAPVWSRSAHTSRVDVQLNSTVRLILWYPPFYTSPMASSALQH